LERRYPDRWGKRDKMDLTSGGKPLSWKQFIEESGEGGDGE
jgi:hypothetical protein